MQTTWRVIADLRNRASYSHPSRSIYDWTLGLNLTDSNALELPGDLLIQLKIEKFCDKVTRTLFQNPLDPLGVLSEMEQATTMSILRMEYRELEASLSDNLKGDILPSYPVRQKLKVLQHPIGSTSSPRVSIYMDLPSSSLEHRLHTQPNF